MGRDERGGAGVDHAEGRDTGAVEGDPRARTRPHRRVRAAAGGRRGCRSARRAVSPARTRVPGFPVLAHRGDRRPDRAGGSHHAIRGCDRRHRSSRPREDRWRVPGSAALPRHRIRSGRSSGPRVVARAHTRLAGHVAGALPEHRRPRGACDGTSMSRRDGRYREPRSGCPRAHPSTWVRSRRSRAVIARAISSEIAS